MVYNAQMIRFHPHIYIYKVYVIKGHFCPPPASLEKGQGGRGSPCAPLSGVPAAIAGKAGANDGDATRAGKMGEASKLDA